uniref:Uncharacterized protein n=1 Tax=Oryza punctata TaxID=4537 RepID=A0A0E0L0J5_ORYPU
MDRLEFPMLATKYKLILATKANYHSLILQVKTFGEDISSESSSAQTHPCYISNIFQIPYPKTSFYE